MCSNSIFERSFQKIFFTKFLNFKLVFLFEKIELKNFKNLKKLMTLHVMLRYCLKYLTRKIRKLEKNEEMNA